MTIKGMDDVPDHLPEHVNSGPIPISSAELPFERIEPPIDPARPMPLMRSASEPIQKLNPEETQFSLRGMMILLTIACCVLAVGARVRIDIFAGTLGILTLVTGGIMSLLDVRRALVHLGWWILLGAYVFVCFAAVMQQTK